MFATVLYNLKSSENAGLIVRTHVAMGGGPVAVVGPAPWRGKKRFAAFSRGLERIVPITYLADDDGFFRWCAAVSFTPVAVEIAEGAAMLPGFRFPERPALVVGHEGRGLPAGFLERCAATVTIPQFGAVECLNTAVACAIAIYELNR
jgi:23S rRNA (guanosine2251-2'-O)-methyltransferase